MGLIYCATNIIDNKKYIGKTKRSLETRAKEHIDDSMSKTKKKYLFLEKLHEFGKDSFIFETIEECDNKELSGREIYYIKTMNTLYPNGYNISRGGNGWSWRDKKTSAAKLSASIKCRPCTWGDKISETISGDNHWTRKNGYSAKSIEAMRLANTGSKRPINVVMQSKINASTFLQTKESRAKALFERRKKSLLSEEKVRKIRKLYLDGIGIKAIASEFSLSTRYTLRIAKKERWADVQD